MFIRVLTFSKGHNSDSRPAVCGVCSPLDALDRGLTRRDNAGSSLTPAETRVFDNGSGWPTVRERAGGKGNGRGTRREKGLRMSAGVGGVTCTFQEAFFVLLIFCCLVTRGHVVTPRSPEATPPSPYMHTSTTILHVCIFNDGEIKSIKDDIEATYV